MKFITIKLLLVSPSYRTANAFIKRLSEFWHEKALENAQQVTVTETLKNTHFQPNN
jgi:hypothetical protein